MTQVQNQDWRSLQKQSTGVEDKVKLNVNLKLDCRFVTVDSVKKAAFVERVQNEADGSWSDKMHDVIKGVYVGAFMVIEGWDDKKIPYQTTPYFQKTDLVYINDRNRSFSGQFSAVNAQSEMIRRNIEVRTRVVVILATEKGIVTIKTNSYLWFNMFKKFQYNDVSKDYLIEVYPAVFDPKDPMFSAIGKEYSEKMTDNNFPTCVSIKQGVAIDSIKNVNDKYRLTEAFKNYIDYEKSIKEQRPKNYTAPTPQNAVSVPQQNNTVPVSAAPFTAEEPGDDLPF